MPDSHHQDDEVLILDAADDAVRIHPIAPKAPFLASKLIAETPWVFSGGDARS